MNTVNTFKTNPELRELARKQLKGKWGKAVIATLIFSAISILIGSTGLINESLGNIISFILSGPLTYGLYKFFLNIVRDNDLSYSDLFDGFRHFGRTLVLYLVMVVLVLLWTLLLIIPGIIASLSYSMAFYILIDDPEIKPMDALRKSKKMMQGNRVRYFLLNLSFIGWGILCILTLGIGVLWLMPYMQTSVANFYEDLKNQVQVQEIN